MKYSVRSIVMIQRCLVHGKAMGQEQIAALRSLCDEMETLMPRVVALGGYVPRSPRSVVEMRLALLS